MNKLNFTDDTDWYDFTGNELDWDSNLDKKGSHYRQLTSWADLKKKKGWEVIRAQRGQKQDVMIQVLYKKFFFITFFFIPGGAIGLVNKIDEKFIKFILKKAAAKIFYLRIDDGSYSKKNLEFFEKSKNWSRPLFRMNESKCAYFDLKGFDINSNYFEDATRDFKSSLRSCRNKKLSYYYNKDVSSEDLAEISVSMFNKKKIKMMELEDFDNFKSALKDKILFIIAYNENKVPLAYRAVLIFKKRAWDLAAATSQMGRKKHAGFGLLEKTIDLLISNSIDEFNLGALNSQTSGVNAFKIGSGAKERFYVGEYEYRKFLILRVFVNLFISISLSKKLIGISFLRRFFF